MNISFGSRHSLSQSWEEKQSTVHTCSPCTTCTTGSRWNMGLECLHVCMCHVQNISILEDLQRRLHQEENSWWANDPSWWVDFDQISVSTSDIGEDFNWFWPHICFNSWYRWGLHLLNPHDWVSNPRSIFLEWMFFHTTSCTVHLESTGGALPLKSTGKPLPVNPLARKGVLSHVSHISVCFFCSFSCTVHWNSPMTVLSNKVCNNSSTFVCQQLSS